MQDYCIRGESELHTTQHRQAVYSPGAARGCQRVENDIRVRGFLQKAGQDEWTSRVGTGNLIHYQGEGSFPITDFAGVLMPLDSACWGQDPRTGPSGQGGSKSLSEVWWRRELCHHNVCVPCFCTTALSWTRSSSAKLGLAPHTR